MSVCNKCKRFLTAFQFIEGKMYATCVTCEQVYIIEHHGTVRVSEESEYKEYIKHVKECLRKDM